MIGEQSLAPETEVEDTSLAPPPIAITQEQERQVPYNVEEQAMILAAADDTTPQGGVNERAATNVVAIREGRAKELRQPIMTQEYQSYSHAMEDQANTRAALGDMEGTRQSLEVAYSLQKRAALAIKHHNTTEHIVTSTRAVERAVVGDAANLDVPIQQIQSRIEDWGQTNGLRNALLSVLEKEGDTPILDGASYIGVNFLPFVWAGYSYQYHRVAERVTGESIPLSTNPLGWINAIRMKWEALDSAGQQALLSSLVKDEYGIFGDNKMSKKIMLDMLANYDSVQAHSHGALEALGFGADIFLTLGKQMANIVRAGVPAKVLAETAGKRVVGRELADAMVVDGLKAFGINNPEAVAKAIAAGKHPYSLDPSVFDGASPHINARLRDHWIRMVAGEEERLIATGIPAVERQNAIAAIRASYSADVRKDVYAIKFAGAPDGDRVKFTVLLTDEEGKLHSSEEAARAYARRRGLADDAWHLTTPLQEAALEEGVTRSLIKAFHGGDDFSDFRMAFIGRGQGGNSLGHGFYTTLVRDMAERFARGRSLEGKSGTLYELKLPDVKHFLDFDKKFTAQSAEVKAALSRALTADEIVALKGKTGRDVYDVLKNRLGTEARASNELEKSGIVGNTGTTMGRDRELVVFSEDVMNNGLVRKNIVTSAETAAQRAARKAGETVGDEEGNALLKEFGSAEADATRMAVNMHKSFMDVPPATNVALTKTATNFDLSSKTIWEPGSSPAQFSGAFTEDAKQYVTGFLKLIGMENERALFLTREDLPKLASRAEFSGENGQRIVGGIAEVFARGQADATYSAIRGNSGRVYHIITTAVDPTSVQGVKALAHEVGHLFDLTYLQGLGVKERNALFEDFSGWLASKKKGGVYDIPAIMGRVVAPDSKNLDTFELLRMIAKGELEALPQDAEGTARYTSWITDFHEYLAEQMSKWALTDERAVTVGERVWANWGARLRAFYRDIVSQMLRLFSKEVLKMEPDAIFKNLMDNHIAALQRNELRTALTELTAETRMSIKGPVAEPSTVGPAKAAVPEKEGFLLKFTVDDPVNANGVYDPTDINSMPWIAADPRHGVSVDAMAGRVIGVHQTAKMQRDMVEMLKPALTPLSRKQRERVLAVLEEGDQASWAGGYGKEFSAAELIARDFTDVEMNAYFTVRQSRMLNYFIHNKAMVDSMRRKGLMEVEVYGQGKFAGKALSVEDAAKYDGKQVYDMRTKEFVEFDSAKAYGSGQRLIEAARGSKVDGQEVTRFLATEKDATVRTVHTAIHYRPGEFARIYSDNYFIRMASDKMIDGAKTATEYPIRTAATQKEAEAFIKAMTEGKAAVDAGLGTDVIDGIVGKYYPTNHFRDMVNSGELKDMTGMRYHFTREVDDYLGQTLESHAHTGKLFTRDRGEHILTADRTREARSNILNPYDSLSSEISMVSHFANATEWKEAQITRWMNTFGEMLGKSRTGDDVRDFFAAAGARFSHVTGKEGLFAERTHAYIMRQVGIQTDEHHWWQALMRRIGEGQPFGEGIGAVIRETNPLNFIRSINHHLTLGMFNLSQLIVQANGMSIAAAIHPIFGLKAAGMYPAIRVALMSDNPEVWARISKVAGEDVGKVAAAIRKSGLIDNLRSTSLHNIEDGKMDIFASLPMRGLATARDKGAFFFNRGEEASRIIAFDIARREWMKLNPDKAFDSQAGMQWIISKADDYTMNMTRANLARWQEGVMSIPTQFLQYNIKLAQNIASGLISGGGKGRGFTRAEALKALGGSIVFYGAAGMGVSNLVGEWIGEDNAAKIPPVVRTAIGQGVIAAAFKGIVEATTGERFEVAFGPRLGSINYFTDLVYNAYHDPKNVYEVMLGPTLSTVQRIGVITNIGDLWRKQEKVTLADVGKGSLEFFTEQVSSLRNATKAYYIAQGGNVLRNRKGESVAELSTPEIWAQAVGLAPAAAYDYYQMVSSRRDHFKALDDIATMIFATHKKILQAYNAGDNERADRMYKALALMYPENYGDFVHVQSQVREKLAPYDTEFQKLMNEHALKGGVYNKPFQTTTPDVKR